MYTVFGASGHTGRIVAERLIAAGKSVRAVVRDVAKAPPGSEAFVADVTDRAAVLRAVAGAEAAYFVLPPDLRSRDLIGAGRAIATNYAEALRTHGTRHAVALSSMGAQHPTGTGPSAANHHAEQLLGATPTTLTFLRPPFFMENLAGTVQPMVTAGVLPVFGGGEQHAFPMIAARDIAAAAVAALLDPPAATRVVELRGPRDYSYADAAAIASQLLGRAVTATPLPLEALVPTLVERAGYSPEVAALMRELQDGIRAGLFAYADPARAVAGTTPLETVLRELLA